MDSILEGIGAVALFGGGGIAMGFGLFKWFGQKWIEDRFARELTSLQHEQNKVLATMKVEIESTLNGALKLQEREFEALPRLWLLLLQSYAAAQSYLSPIELLPNVNEMSSEVLEEHLAGLKWLDGEKRYLREAEVSKRDEVYSEISQHFKFRIAHQDWFKANIYVKEQAIALPVALTKQFEQLQQLLFKLIWDRQVAVETRNYLGQHAAYTEFYKDVEPLLKQVEVAIRERLESHRLGGKPVAP